MLRRFCEWSIAEPRTHCEETDGAGGLGARQYYSTPYRYYSSIDGLLNRRCYAVGANRPGRPLVAERSNRRPTTRRDVRVLGTLSGTHSPCEVRRDKLSPLVVSVLRLVPEVQVLDHLNKIRPQSAVRWASTTAQRKLSISTTATLHCSPIVPAARTHWLAGLVNRFSNRTAATVAATATRWLALVGP